ncbi:MAG: hypothetical protein WCG45_03505 [bacterium]
MHFKITENEVGRNGEPYKYSALCDVPNAYFSGSGDSIAEAIGDCISSNREELNITFDVHTKDGQVLRSTVYGKSRSRIHSFKFENKKWNKKLISLLKKKAKNKFDIDDDGSICYFDEDKNLIENDIIQLVRNQIFPQNQIFSVPADSFQSYIDYMNKNKICFETEKRDEDLRIVLSIEYMPLFWDLKN